MPFLPLLPLVTVPSGAAGGVLTGTYPNPGLAAASAMQLQAGTPAAGFAKQNGTPTILTWNVPNDGLPHRALIACSEVVTALETGGQVSYTFTPPGGVAVTTAIIAAAAGAGSNAGNTGNRPAVSVAPGSVVTVAQTTALTAGGPTTVFAEIWGS